MGTPTQSIESTRSRHLKRTSIQIPTKLVQLAPKAFIPIPSPIVIKPAKHFTPAFHACENICVCVHVLLVPFAMFVSFHELIVSGLVASFSGKNTCLGKILYTIGQFFRGHLQICCFLLPMSITILECRLQVVCVWTSVVFLLLNTD